MFFLGNYCWFKKKKSLFKGKKITSFWNVGKFLLNLFSLSNVYLLQNWNKYVNFLCVKNQWFKGKRYIRFSTVDWNVIYIWFWIWLQWKLICFYEFEWLQFDYTLYPTNGACIGIFGSYTSLYVILSLITGI